MNVCSDMTTYTVRDCSERQLSGLYPAEQLQSLLEVVRGNRFCERSKVQDRRFPVHSFGKHYHGYTFFGRGGGHSRIIEVNLN